MLQGSLPWPGNAVELVCKGYPISQNYFEIDKMSTDVPIRVNSKKNCPLSHKIRRISKKFEEQPFYIKVNSLYLNYTD